MNALNRNKISQYTKYDFVQTPKDDAVSQEVTPVVPPPSMNFEDSQRVFVNGMLLSAAGIAVIVVAIAAFVFK